MKYLKFLFLAIVIVCLSISFYNIFTLDRTNTDLNTKLEQTEKTYSGRIDSMTIYQEGLCAKISKLQDNVSSLQTSYNNLQETYQAYVDENELKLENLKTELAEVKASLADLQANSDVDKAKIAELQTKIANLEKSIDEKNVSIEQLNSTIETQKTTIAELNKTITDLTKDLNSDLSQLTFYNNLMEGTVTEITAEDLKGVTKIRPYAFHRLNTSFSIVLPNTITSIGREAFSYSNIISLVIPGSVKELGYGLCWICPSLKNVVISEGVSSIPDSSFNDCDALNSIVIPSSVTSIGVNAFRGSNKLTSVIIPSSVIEIGDEAFVATLFIDSLKDSLGNCVYTCSDGKKIVLSASNTISSFDFTDVYLIAGAAFRYCNNLTSLSIPDDIIGIGNYAFYSCDELSSVTIPSSVLYVGNYAFYDCPKLSSLTMSEGLMRIGYSAFEKCSALTSVMIPNGVKTIDYNAFYDCTLLESVTIPSSVEYLGCFAFSGTPFIRALNGIYTCSDGKKILISLYNMRTDFDLTDVYLIAYRGFYYSDMTTIVIPSSVKFISGNAFESFHGYSFSIIFASLTPPTLSSDAFGGSDINKITVPPIALEAYKMAPVFKDYADKIV